MSRFKFLGISALALGLIAAGTAAAQGYVGGHMHGGGPNAAGMVEHLTKALDLTADQQSKVETIVSKYQEGSLGDVMKTAREAHMTLEKTVHNPDATDKQVQDAAAVAAMAESKMAIEHHHMAVEIAGLLTSDQKARLAQLSQGHGEPGDGPMMPRTGGF